MPTGTKSQARPSRWALLLPAHRGVHRRGPEAAVHAQGHAQQPAGGLQDGLAQAPEVRHLALVRGVVQAPAHRHIAVREPWRLKWGVSSKAAPGWVRAARGQGRPVMAPVCGLSAARSPQPGWGCKGWDGLSTLPPSAPSAAPPGAA